MALGGSVGVTIRETVFACFYFGKNILKFFFRTTRPKKLNFT
jgi:hypothetical protein